MHLSLSGTTIPTYLPELGALGVQAANSNLQAGSWQYGAGKKFELQRALKV